jgi:2-polyprenyl-3-methyl-5-hydroxy-6-metoxy-1,4-benzoquinol methylase
MALSPWASYLAPVICYKLYKQDGKSIMTALLRELFYPIPSALRIRHTQIDAAGVERIRNSIQTHYHQGWRAKENYSQTGYEHDLNAHLYARLEGDRRFVVPWLNSARALNGMRVLEIGCGTGSSSVALAEQGAHVTALDIDAPALEVARERCRIHGVSVDIREANATQVLGYGPMDAVLYFAALEHMTNAERLQSLGEAWSLLSAGGLLAIIETPNRLWYFDHHTSQLPFYNWLPHDLAIFYSRFSPRENFKDAYLESSANNMSHFLRRGRGASYHEIDVAIAPTQNLDTVSSLTSYFGWRRRIRMKRLARNYKALLRQVRPDLHEGWFDIDLDVIIRKH